MGQNKSEESEENSIEKWLNKKLNRRSFLQKTQKIAGALTGAGLIGTLPFISVGCAPYIKSDSKSLEYPFTLGVASGEPLPDGVVLWTRLAPNPLIGGGMPSKPVEVHWEVSQDQSFERIVKQGKTVADPHYAHSVHVEVDGLEPDNWYYYRFKVGSETSRIGRTKTAPAYDAEHKELNFAFASCQNYAIGYYTAYDHLVKENIDVVFFLGDYIYEGPASGDIGRGHLPQKEIRTLDEYRIRYGQYKSDASLQAAHAAFPWIVSFDDHEVKNNWGGEGPPYSDNEDFLTRRAAAFQAFYEHMPLRKASVPDHVEIQLYRKFSYGNLAEINMLDTRQFRTDFACGGRSQKQCKARFDPSRTMLGKEQEKWLFSNLKKPSANWNLIPQQVRMAQVDQKKGPDSSFSMDKWDGYVATRNRLFNTIKQNSISNLIVLTGDSHNNWVNNLKEDFDEPNSKILGTEFMGTSISSGGNGVDITKRGKRVMTENPHIKFNNAQRGYVRCQLTHERLKVDFRIIPYVKKPNAPVQTRASFVVKNGQPGAVRV